MLDEIKKDPFATFTCHKASIEGKKIVCRGFYQNSKAIGLEAAEAMGMIEFVE